MTKKTKGGRVFEVVSQLFHPETGKRLISKKSALQALRKYKSVGRYALVIHDKDFLTQDEIREEWTKRGETFTEEQVFQKWQAREWARPAHLHVVFETPRNYFPVENIAKWFGVAPNFVRVKRGYNAFIDSVEYLTHEDEKQQDLGKFRYPDSEIVANFDWREEVTRKTSEKAKYGKAITDRERLQLDVLFHGLTLKQARLRDPYNYNKDLSILKRNRGDYLQNQQPPAFKINLYICGSGGIGKDLMARAIARSAFPQFIDDDEIFFEVGARNVEFEGYDGQPVIIWSDSRAGDLVSRWGRENLLGGILEPYPVVARKQNIKYSSTSLVNAMNIFTGADDYETFLNGIVGEYTDKNGVLYKSENKAQSYRRFPLIIPVYQSNFDILLNDGFMNDSYEWLQYFHYKKVSGSFRQIARQLSFFPEKRQEEEQKILSPVSEKLEEIKKKGEGASPDEIKLLEAYEGLEDFGKEIPLTPFEKDLAVMSRSELNETWGRYLREYKNYGSEKEMPTDFLERFRSVQKQFRQVFCE